MMSGEVVNLASDRMKAILRHLDTVIVKGSKIPIGNN